MGRFLKGEGSYTLKGSTVGGFDMPAGVTSERLSSPDAGLVRFNTTTGNLEFFDGTQYQDFAVKGNVTITKDSFTGDDVTTDYLLSVTPTNENNILVFVGNVHQNPGVAYTLTGATISFTSAPPLSQSIIVLHGFDSTSV